IDSASYEKFHVCPLARLKSTSSPPALLPWRVSVCHLSGERRDGAQERLDLWAPPGRALDERQRVQAPSVAVHVLAQPIPDRADLSHAQVILARAELGLERLP